MYTLMTILNEALLSNVLKHFYMLSAPFFHWLSSRIFFKLDWSSNNSCYDLKFEISISLYKCTHRLTIWAGKSWVHLPILSCVSPMLRSGDTFRWATVFIQSWGPQFLVIAYLFFFLFLYKTQNLEGETQRSNDVNPYFPPCISTLEDMTGGDK